MASITELKSMSETDEAAVAVPIYQRNGDPYLAADGTTATISVIGSESAAYRKARKAITKRMTRGNLDVELTRVEMAAIAVTSWHGWEDNGAPFPCTPANVKVLLSVEHILTQVEAGIGRYASFFGSGA